MVTHTPEKALVLHEALSHVWEQQDREGIRLYLHEALLAFGLAEDVVTTYLTRG
ncbi:MAG: hypothetical protein R2795_10000 [Saprospiraceae bacterium]